jgi:cobalamin biosynthesis protein CobD/CbiB
VEERPALGDGRAPASGDIEAAVRLSLDVGLALAAGLLAVAGGLRGSGFRGTRGGA